MLVERPRETFVFVPGAWLGGWTWNPVARLLREAGYGVVTLTLPGLSYGSSPIGLRLADAVAHVVTEVETQDLQDIVLVSHSWGGYPATGAAHRLKYRISKIIYYNAVVPARGQAMIDENEQKGEATRELMAATPDGTVALPLEAVRMALMQDESSELQELVFHLAVPQPGGYMTDSLDLPTVVEIGLPASYVLGIDDQALARPGTEFAARIGIEPLMAPGSHMAMLSRPDAIADALRTALS